MLNHHLHYKLFLKKIGPVKEVVMALTSYSVNTAALGQSPASNPIEDTACPV